MRLLEKRKLVKDRAALRVTNFPKSIYPHAILTHVEIAADRFGVKLPKETLREIAEEIRSEDSRYG
jgi:hypothetical protein